MDYDDSDFQSQNLHLAGEGSIECPPVSQSYGLPKFDFDQGHLRFDSLVETEVFLGIESSVSNNWIEDFSRGSSGIEFSSSAVESCSISRRNNVWSEATSSESVEMLLKSVGQEEIIPAQTIFKESDVYKEADCIKQMEPNSKNEDNILTETGVVRDLQHSASLLDEIPENLSGIQDAEDQPQLEDASQTREVELPLGGSSIVLDPNSNSGQIRLPVTRGSPSDEKGNDVNNMEIDDLVNYPPDKTMHEDSSASEMQVDIVMTSVQSTVTSSNELNNQNSHHHIKDIGEENLNSHVPSIDVRCSNDLDKPHCLVSEVESLEKESADADPVTDVQEQAKFMSQEESSLPTIAQGGDSEYTGVLAESKKYEDMVVFKETVVDCEQSTMTITEELRNNLGEISSSPDPILKGGSDLLTVHICSDREHPEGVDATTKAVISFKGIDAGGVSSNLDQNDSGDGTEPQNNVIILSSLDLSVEEESNIHTAAECSDKESLEVPADANSSEHVISLKDTDIGGDQSKMNAMTCGRNTGNAVEHDKVISSCVIPLTTDKDLHTFDASSDQNCSNDPAEATKYEGMMFSKSLDSTIGESNMNPHGSSASAYESDTVCQDVVGNNTSGASSQGLSLKMDSEKTREEGAMESGSQPLDFENLVRNSKASMTINEETNVLKGVSDENPEGNSLSEMPSVLNVTETFTRPHDTVVLTEGISGICVLDPPGEKHSSKSLIEPNIMDPELVGSAKRDGSSSILEDSAEKELIPTQKHDIDVNASVDDVPLERCDQASCDTMDIPSSAENGATTQCHNVLVIPAAPPPAVESYSGNKEDIAIEISKDAGLSCPVPSPVVESGRGAICEAEKDTPSDSSGKLLSKTRDRSMPTSIGYITENKMEPGAAVGSEITKSRTTDMEIKGGDNAETHDGATTSMEFSAEEKSKTSSENVKGDTSGNFKVPTLPACLPVPCSKSADPDQLGCGSKTTEIPLTEHGIANVMELTHKNAADTDKVGEGSKHSSNSSNPTGNDVFQVQKYHTSDVTSFADLPIGFAANNQQPLPTTSAPKIVEGSLTNYGSGQIDAKLSQEVSLQAEGEIASGGSKVTTERKRRRASTEGTVKESAKKVAAKASLTNYGSGQIDAKLSQEVSLQAEGEIASGGSKVTTERKRRRASTKGTVIESAKKVAAKASTPIRQADRGDKSSIVSLGKSGIFQFAQPNEIQHYGLVDSSSNSYSILTGSTSSLPDLNSSAPASLVFQQPFTDLQQVQLRAQIFVYGALIQGTAPDEAHMMSAYGGPDGGRSIWENVWRIGVERQHSHKSTPINPETPMQSSPGAFQANVISTPAGRANTKGIPPPASPMIPIQSPLWSIPTPGFDAPQYGVLPQGPVMEYSQVHSPLLPFQTSPIRNIVGQNSSWMSQSAYWGPWVAPTQTSAAETNIRFSAFPSTESVVLTPVKETTSSLVSNIKHGPSIVSGQTGGLTSVSAGGSPLLDPKKVGVVSPGEPSSKLKSRKRKKVSDSKQLGQISLQPHSQSESAVALTVASDVSTSVAVTTQNTFVFNAMPGNLATPVLSDHLNKADPGLQQPLSKESYNKAKEARQQAEEASANAAAAVAHSQEIWSQLDKRKHSRMTSDAVVKIASAAVAVAAAAAVAKAAAAAANVAANAAMQAILMAEEACGNQSTNTMDIRSDGNNALGMAAPEIVFRAEDGTSSSSSILVAAREAARRRVEAASSVSKRAENMDAILKAAELAAEAVSHAGTIVAMDDPLPLSELAKAGPEGYWKAPLVSSELIKKSNEGMRDQLNFSAPGSEDSDKEETQIYAASKSPLVGETGTEITRSFLPTAGSDFEKAVEASKYIIVEGSQVEVFKEGVGFAAGWFTATVLSLQDGKACVCYTELQSDEGSGNLQEWVALDSEENKPPKIRVARLLTPSLEGTRKRRREAMADYAWSVGDKVDAWIRNSWWEGVVTEKNKKDETILIVHFPAQGETSHVKAWHLRPSLIWKDGKWVEWFSLQNDGSFMEVGLPKEKRVKLGSPAVAAKGNNKTFSSSGLDSGKPEEPKLLNLSATEKIFNIGKNARIENKLHGVRTNRTGLQKEGSVKFGIPKPKRKFMEVSKHYSTDQTSNDSLKSAKSMMSQTPGFRAIKNTSKFDSKDREGAESKLKGSRSERNVMKDNPAIVSYTRKNKDSVRQGDGLSGKRNVFESGPSYSSDGRALGAPTFSTRTPSSDFPSFKKVGTTGVKSVGGNKGNLAPAVGKLSKIDENKGTSSNPVKSSSEGSEPRRSNRRIQPTSRMLEGLQSSLSISKIPLVPRDKGPRSQNRKALRGVNRD